MLRKIFNGIRSLLKEDTKESFTLFISLTSGIAFLAVSFFELYFCVIRGSPSWTHYESFAMWTAGGGILSGLGNKVINTHKSIKVPKLKEDKREDDNKQ